MTRMYNADGVAGCVQSRRARSTCTVVSIYRCDQAGLDTEGGAWATVCEDHGGIVNHGTLAAAREWAPVPGEWCPDCQETPSPTQETST